MIKSMERSSEHNHTKMGTITKLSKWFKRYLNEETRLMVRVGYLNEDLERTKAGASLLLNIVEEKYHDELLAKLKETEAEAEAEAKKTYNQ